MSLDPRLLAFAAAAGTGIQVGAAMVASRFVVDQTGPGSLAFLRYLIATLCLAPVVIVARQSLRVAPRDVLPIVVLGVAQFAAIVVLLNFALQFVTAARATLLFSTMPLMTVALAALLGRERLSGRAAAGLGLTVVGVALALDEKLTAPGEATSEWIGVLAALASALIGAVCSVFYRPYLQRYPTLAMSLLAMLASVACLALAAAAEGLFARPPAFTAAGWVAILFIGFSSAVGYFLWLHAHRHVPASNVTAFLGLSPISAALIGAIVLGERLTPGVGAGLACVVAGLWIALWRRVA